jgi:hypothetical protein
MWGEITQLLRVVISKIPPQRVVVFTSETIDTYENVWYS